MNNNRREFFKTLGTAAAGVAAASPFITSADAVAAIPKGELPTYIYGLALQGSIAGLIRDFDGGEAYSEVVREAVNEFGIVGKHLGPLRYEDISMRFGTNLSPQAYGWISSFLARDPVARDGAILAADVNSVVRSQVTFIQALLTEVRFPELDVLSKDPAYLSIKLNPEVTRNDPPSIPSLSSSKGTKNKLWLASNFRVRLGSVTEAATSRVTKVDAFSIKQKITDAEVGETRDPETTVEPLDIGSIALTVPERFAQPFLDWHRQFVVLGNNGQDSETVLTIEYLTPKGEVIFTLYFGGVGIFRASRVGENDKKTGQRSVRVELYAERANFFVGELPES